MNFSNIGHSQVTIGCERNYVLYATPFTELHNGLIFIFVSASQHRNVHRLLRHYYDDQPGNGEGNYVLT